MFGLFKKRLLEVELPPVLGVPALPQQELIVTSEGRMHIRPELLVGSALRRRPTTYYRAEQPPKRGMWVYYQGEIGILTNLMAGDVAEVMLTDAQGLNKEPIKVQADQLRQAYLHEIPEPRRPALDIGTRLGYIV
jgi:hypothetical protein